MFTLLTVAKRMLVFVLSISLSACFADIGQGIAPNTKAPIKIVASVTGEPINLSNSTSLNVSVSGDEVVSYRYKIGLSSAIDCSDPSGYSIEFDKAVSILDDISSYPDGSISLCTIGVDAQGNTQAYNQATQKTWIKDTVGPSVSMGASTPGVGNSATTFSTTLNVTGADNIDLQTASIMLLEVGGVSCANTSIVNGTSANPIILISNCTGSGSFRIRLNLGAFSDAAGNLSPAYISSSINVSNGISCPTGYIVVPGNPTYATSDFCVMKYEAKAQRNFDDGVSQWGCDNDTDPSTGDGSCTGAAVNWTSSSGVNELYYAVSIRQGRPWRMIERDRARQMCRALNSELGMAIDSDTDANGTYELMTNDEWQSIARNIELVPVNWVEGVVGGTDSGNGGTDANYINKGHSDSTPLEPLIAAASDTDACFNTGQEVNAGVDNSCTGAGAGFSLQKRTHELSNGQVIWDFSGNVEEWVVDDPGGSLGSPSDISQITATSHPGPYNFTGGLASSSRDGKSQIGPVGNYLSLNSGNFGGLGNLNGPFSLGALTRGGRYNNSTGSGIFAVNQQVSNSGEGRSYIGFRCVYRP
jgi:hypothetical protein